MSVNTGNPWVDVGVAVLANAGRLFGGSRDTDLNKRQRQRFEQAGGNVIGHREGAPRGSPRYEWQGERVSKREAKRILREIDAGRITRPASPVDVMPPPQVIVSAPVIWGAVNAPIPFPPRDQIERERARRKLERAAKKAKGKLRVKPKPNQLEWLLKRIPYIKQLRRYWGPTGYLYAGQKIWRNRKKIWENYKAWEAQQPRTRAQVIRAPGPGVIPRDAEVWGPKGPPRRYTPQARPVSLPSKGPRTRPTVWLVPGASPLPGVVPRASPRPAYRPRPNVSAAPRPSSSPARRPAPSSWPAPTSSPAPGTPKSRTPSWLRDIVGPVLLAAVLQPARAPRGRGYGNISLPGVSPSPLTGYQSYPLPLAQPQPQSAKCKCPKPKKRTGTSCRNPVVSRRKRVVNGRTLITTTRELKCRA